MHEWAHYCDKAANHQLPIAVAFWIIWIVFTEEQNLMQIHCSTCSVILIVTATQYTCSLSGIYHPHWLVQWSCHCSHVCIPVHSPWLPGYISVAQTILVILTMAGLFLGRCMPRVTISPGTNYSSKSKIKCYGGAGVGKIEEKQPVLLYTPHSFCKEVQLVTFLL